MTKAKQTHPFILKNSLRSVLAILPVLAAGNALAADIIWEGNADNDFFNQNNWTPTTNPSSTTDNLLVESSKGNTINLNFDGTNNTIGSGAGTTTIGSGAGNTAKMNIVLDLAQSSSGATINGELILGASKGTGILNYNHISNPADPDAKPGITTQKFSIGQGMNSTGEANFFGSGKTVSQQRYYGQSELTTGQIEIASGTGAKGTLNLNGASIDLDNASNPLPLGQPAFLLGSGANSVGEVNLLGGGKIGASIGSHSYNTPTAIIGQDGGQGSLLISGTIQNNGDTVRSRAYFGQGLIVGDGNNSIGSVRVENGGLLAAFAPRSGSENLAAQLGVNGGTGSVIVSGDDSQWQISGQTPSANSTGASGTVGQLHIGVSGTGEVTVNNGGKVSVGKTQYDYVTTSGGSYGYSPVFDNTDLGNIYLADTLNSTGIINIGAAAGSAAANTGIIEAKEIIFGIGQGALVFNHLDTTGNYIFDVDLTSSNAQPYGEIRHIAGVTNFNTNQSNFLGTSNIRGGTMVVNGILGGTVNALGNGTLAGTGTVGSTTIDPGGTISPGSYSSTTPATLTINGNLTMNNGARYQADILANTTSDLIQVNGNATVGGTVEVRLGDDRSQYTIGDRWKIVSATGSLTGQFSTLLELEKAYIGFKYDYDAKNAYLILTRLSSNFCLAGMTYNQCSVANNADRLDPSSELYQIVLNLPAVSTQYALDQLSGEMHASAKGAALEDSRFLREAINNRLLDTHQQKNPNGSWAHAFGSWGSINGDGNAAQFKRDIGGAFFGVDTEISDNWQLGAMAGVSKANIKTTDRHSHAKRDDHHLGAYIGHDNGSLSLRAGMGMSWHGYYSTRNVSIHNLTENLDAYYRGSTLQTFAEGGYKFQPNNNSSVEPFINAAYVQNKIRAFTEKGGIAALHSDKDKTEALISTVGVRASQNFTLAQGQQVKLTGLAGWKHTFNHTDTSSNFNFDNAKPFKVLGVSIPKNTAVLELGAEINLTPTVKAGLMYNGNISSQAKDHGGKAYVEWQF